MQGDIEVDVCMALRKPSCSGRIGSTRMMSVIVLTLCTYDLRSEFGQRALGARSILGDPRAAAIRVTVNRDVKEREWFRPLAPSVLDEEAGQWFEDVTSGKNVSPFMSVTAVVRPEKRLVVPAICHVDGTARLQTVTQKDNDLYHALIREFQRLTGVPMVLNTSFNRKGEPIVESPLDALRTFIESQGAIRALFIGEYELEYIPCPLEFTGLAALASEPTAEEAELRVAAKPFYLSEVISNPMRPEQASRIRVQTGGSGSEPGEDWLELPSNLHLELLQLLQPQLTDAEYAVEEQLGDVFDAMRDIRDDITWQDIKGALFWLYRRGMVSFTPPEPEPEPVLQTRLESGGEAEAGGHISSTASEEVETPSSVGRDSLPPSDDVELEDFDFEGLFRGEGVDVVDLRIPLN